MTYNELNVHDKDHGFVIQPGSGSADKAKFMKYGTKTSELGDSYYLTFPNLPFAEWHYTIGMKPKKDGTTDGWGSPQGSSRGGSDINWGSASDDAMYASGPEFSFGL